MEKKNRKQLITEYRNSKPDMGIIYLHCKKTDEYYLALSKNTKANMNRNIAQLNFNSHPNKELLNLWKECGEEGFEYGVLEKLEYDEKQPDKQDYSKELEVLFNKKMSEYKNAKLMR